MQPIHKYGQPIQSWQALRRLERQPRQYPERTLAFCNSHASPTGEVQLTIRHMGARAARSAAYGAARLPRSWVRLQWVGTLETLCGDTYTSAE